MGTVTNLEEYKTKRKLRCLSNLERDEPYIAALEEQRTPDPVETGQFTNDWLDNFAGVHDELRLLVEDVERKLEEKKPLR